MPNGMAASQLRVVVSIQMSGAHAKDHVGGLERRKKIHARGHPKNMERVRGVVISYGAASCSPLPFTPGASSRFTTDADFMLS
jgi:hypothetical protein